MVIISMEMDVVLIVKLKVDIYVKVVMLIKEIFVLIKILLDIPYSILKI